MENTVLFIEDMAGISSSVDFPPLHSEENAISGSHYNMMESQAK